MQFVQTGRHFLTHVLFTVGQHLRQAQRTNLYPWRQFHNLPEAPGRESWCTLPGPYAITKK